MTEAGIKAMIDQPQDAHSRQGILEFPCGIQRLMNGNTLIADAGSETGKGSEILEVDQEGRIVWNWSGYLNFAHSIFQLGNGRLLIADTSNDRVIEVNRQGQIVFSTDCWSQDSGRLSDGSHLHYPNTAVPIEEGLLLITDRNNDRSILVDKKGTILRSFSGGLKHPLNCEPLSSGNVIIADSDHNCVKEIAPSGKVVWCYDRGLKWPRDANRLANGNTLITDSKNSRVIEVSAGKKIVWEYAVDYFANFYEARRLHSGNTLISDQQHQQVLEVNAESQKVWSFRNFCRENPISGKLTNGFFRKIGADGLPQFWFLGNRFSEGSGRFFWSQDSKGKRIPALEFDSNGALYLQQTVAVTPGTRYMVGGAMKTVGLKGFTCFQVAFLDEMDGLLCDSAASPHGATFTGDSPWKQDSFEVVAPSRAKSADLRVFMTGKGAIYFDQIRFFS